jgi:hypothetical protein
LIPALLKIVIGMIAAGIALVIGVISIVVVVAGVMFIQDHRKHMKATRALHLAGWRKPSIQEKEEK